MDWIGSIGRNTCVIKSVRRLSSLTVVRCSGFVFQRRHVLESVSFVGGGVQGLPNFEKGVCPTFDSSL